MSFHLKAFLTVILLATTPAGFAQIPDSRCPQIPDCSTFDVVLRAEAVVTMDPVMDSARAACGRVANAVGLRDDRIVWVGDASELGCRDKVKDLAGKTIVPGFIDAHSHALPYGLAALGVDGSSTNPFFVPEDQYRPVLSVGDLLDTIQEALPHAGQQMLVSAYDPSRTDSGGMPTRQDLDDLTCEKGIFVWHASMHSGNASSPTLNAIWNQLTEEGFCSGAISLGCGLGSAAADAGQPACTNVPQQYVDSFEGGLVEETMLMLSLGVAAEIVGGGVDPARGAETASQIYADHGFTTGSDVVTGGLAQIYLDKFDATHGAAEGLPLDYVLLPTTVSEGLDLAPRMASRTGLYLAQIKTWADGSLQGQTALLEASYLGDPINHGDMTSFNWTLAKFIEDSFNAGFPVAIHINGDAAATVTLDLLAAAFERYPDARSLRNVFIHAPMTDRAVLGRMADLGIMPSYLIQHPFYWGQPLCRRILGAKRANETYNPARWAAEILPRFSLHSDAFVTPPDPLRMLWSARTRHVQDVQALQGNASGFTGDCPDVLAPDQRLSIERGLRALTLDAAYQFGIEYEKGSIEPGKLADLTILSANPLTMEDDPDKLKDIHVCATLRRGQKHVSSAKPCGDMSDVP